MVSLGFAESVRDGRSTLRTLIYNGRTGSHQNSSLRMRARQMKREKETRVFFARLFVVVVAANDLSGTLKNEISDQATSERDYRRRLPIRSPLELLARVHKAHRVSTYIFRGAITCDTTHGSPGRFTGIVIIISTIRPGIRGPVISDERRTSSLHFALKNLKAHLIFIQRLLRLIFIGKVSARYRREYEGAKTR